MDKKKVVLHKTGENSEVRALQIKCVGGLNFTAIIRFLNVFIIKHNFQPILESSACGRSWRLDGPFKNQSTRS